MHTERSGLIDVLERGKWVIPHSPTRVDELAAYALAASKTSPTCSPDTLSCQASSCHCMYPRLKMDAKAIAHCRWE